MSRLHEDFGGEHTSLGLAPLRNPSAVTQVTVDRGVPTTLVGTRLTARDYADDAHGGMMGIEGAGGKCGLHTIFSTISL
jgi:hypothetical protein